MRQVQVQAAVLAMTSELAQSWAILILGIAFIAHMARHYAKHD